MRGVLLYAFLVLGLVPGASGGQYIVAFALAVGIALMIAGGKGLRENRVYRKMVTCSR